MWECLLNDPEIKTMFALEIHLMSRGVVNLESETGPCSSRLTHSHTHSLVATDMRHRGIRETQRLIVALLHLFPMLMDSHEFPNNAMMLAVT